MQEHSEYQDARTDRRTRTFLAATMQLKDFTCPVKIRNISLIGALVEAAKVPLIGTTIILSRGNLVATAEVVWSKTGFCGVRFTTKVDVARWILENVSRSTASTSNACPIGVITRTKADGLHGAGQSFDDSTILERMTEEILDLGRAMENVSSTLSGDAMLRRRHVRSIQELVIGKEKLDQLAAVLNSSDRVKAIRQIVTGPMRARLLRKSDV